MRMMSVCWPSVGQAGDDCQGGCRGLPGTGVVGVAAGTIYLLDSAAQVHGICCPGNTLPSPKTGVDNDAPIVVNGRSATRCGGYRGRQFRPQGSLLRSLRDGLRPPLTPVLC